MFNSVVFFFLVVTALQVAWANPNTRIYSDSNCQIVEAKRHELIQWNQRIKKSGVETYPSFPKVKKTRVGCEIDLKDFIPRALAEKNLEYFTSTSPTNCFGSALFAAGLNPKLRGQSYVTPYLYFQNLCQKINSSKEVKAGDIALMKTKTSFKFPEVDVHAFTVLTPEIIFQSPNIETGKYPRIFPFQAAIDQYMLTSKNPETDPRCQVASGDQSQCSTWIEYYRCDFSPPSCGQISDLALETMGAIEKLESLQKPNCTSCSAEKETKSCSLQAMGHLKLIEELSVLDQKIGQIRTWEELGAVALNEPTPLMLKIIEKFKNYESLQDPQEKRALALAILRLAQIQNSLREKVEEFENQKLPRPEDAELKYSNLVSGWSFSAGATKDPQIAFDFLACLDVKLSRSKDDFELQDCKRVLDRL